MSDHTIIYMLGADDRNRGPFPGEAGLDFQALAAEFRAQRYAQAESQRDDFCWISNDDFVGWLIERKILSALETTHVEIDIDTTGENAYAPSHWPLCPACGEGRCDQHMDIGMLRPAFNRVEVSGAARPPAAGTHRSDSGVASCHA